MSKMEIDGRTYDAVLDENGEAVQLTRYDEEYQTSITLCFDNSSDGSTSSEVLESLKSRYLKQFLAE